MKKAKLVAVIPAYNEEKTIAKVIILTQQYVDRVIVCDDGSLDMTAVIAERLGATVIKHPVNMGKGEALKSAFEEAIKLNPDVVVTLDADDQHDPNQISELVKPITSGECDVVIGSRYVEGAKQETPFFRKIGLGVINFLYRKFINLPIKDTQSGFRAFSEKAFEVMLSCKEEGYGVESEQLAIAMKNGLNIIEVPIDAKYKGIDTKSKKNSLLHGGELISTFLRLVVTKRPLKYMGVPGALLTLMGVVLATYLLWLFNATQYFDIPLVVLTLVTSIMGLLLIISAVMMYGQERIIEVLNENKLEK